MMADVQEIMDSPMQVNQENRWKPLLPPANVSKIIFRLQQQ